MNFSGSRSTISLSGSDIVSLKQDSFYESFKSETKDAALQVIQHEFPSKLAALDNFLKVRTKRRCTSQLWSISRVIFLLGWLSLSCPFLVPFLSFFVLSCATAWLLVGFVDEPLVKSDRGPAVTSRRIRWFNWCSISKLERFGQGTCAAYEPCCASVFLSSVAFYCNSFDAL